jgi:hypothetical protein
VPLGDPEAAPLERPRTQGTTLTVGQSLDRGPADVAAPVAFGVNLPLRGEFGLPVTAAAEALDDE